MKTIEEMRQAHKVLATYSFTPGGVHAGYTDRRLYAVSYTHLTLPTILRV